MVVLIDPRIEHLMIDAGEVGRDRDLRARRLAGAAALQTESRAREAPGADRRHADPYERKPERERTELDIELLTPPEYCATCAD